MTMFDRRSIRQVWIKMHLTRQPCSPIHNPLILTSFKIKDNVGVKKGVNLSIDQIRSF